MYNCRSVKDTPQEKIIVETNLNGEGLLFELDFEKGKAHNYPLMAVWLEDERGKYIQTLFVARSVGYGEYDHADVSLGE